MSKKYGYARCSLAEEKGQDLNRQVRELKAAGAEEIITEREHGDAKVKQNLDMLLELVQPGDTIICCEVSRLSRSTQQLCEIVNIIKVKHMRLEILGSITIDCRTGDIDPMSQAFIQMSLYSQSWSCPSSAPESSLVWRTQKRRERRLADLRRRRMIFQRFSTNTIRRWWLER